MLSFLQPEEMGFKTELQISWKLSSKSPFHLVESPKFSEIWQIFSKFRSKLAEFPLYAAKRFIEAVKKACIMAKRFKIRIIVIK